MHLFISAKDLLDDWATSKLNFDRDELEYESPMTKKSPYDIKREWDDLLERNGEEAPGEEEEYWAKYVNAYKPSTGMRYYILFIWAI